MDWATFFKDYPLVIPAITTVLVAILGYYFGRRSVRDDRTFTRRAAVYDMRIQEAREVLERVSTVISLISEYFRVLDEENDLKAVHNLLSFHNEDFHKIPNLAMDATKKMSSIDLLSDKKLSELKDILIGTLLSPIEKTLEAISVGTDINNEQFDDVKKDIAEFEKRVKSIKKSKKLREAEVEELEKMVDNIKKKSKIDISDFKKSVDIEKIQTGYEKASTVIVEMHARLDKLASELK